MRKAFKHIFFNGVIFCTTVCIAEPNPPSPAANPPGPPGEQLPIDSSLCILIIIGVAFVFISYLRNKKSQFEK